MRLTLSVVRALIAALAATSILASCGADPSATEDAPRRGRVTGVIIDIEQTSPTDIHSFVVKAGDDRHEFAIDPDRDYGFALSHLRDHLVSADPVTVEFEERDGRSTALSIEDA